MRFLAALAFLFALAASPAAAQDADLAEREALALQLVQITSTDAVMGPMIDAVWPAIEAQLSNPDEQLVTDLKAVFAAEITAALADVLQDIASLYAAEFTLEELQQIVKFYTSAAGTKLVEKQGALMTAMLPTITTRLQETLPGAMERVLEEAAART